MSTETDQPLTGFERPHFQPGRMDPCFCNSGLRFKSCCGSNAPDRKPPYGVHIIRNFLEPAERQALREWADRQPAYRLPVIDQKTSTRDTINLTYSEQRITDKVELIGQQELLDGWILRSVRRVIEPRYGVKVAWFEPPSLMRYSPGGIFKMHADSEKRIPGRNYWQKILDRDISTLMYINDDYEGGWLSFPVFNYRFKPQAGDLITFPSDNRFQHEAETLISGRRYAIACWMALKDQPRVMSGPPNGATLLP